jgi:hypothetical protein
VNHGVPISVNHRFPSAPGAISCGVPVNPFANSVICPLGVIRPVAWLAWSANQRLPSRSFAVGVGEPHVAARPTGGCAAEPTS